MNSKTFSAIILATQVFTLLTSTVACMVGIRSVSIWPVLLGDFSALCVACLLFVEVRAHRG